MSTSHSSACFPLRISCIIYEPLMNMLISRRAGRGERASPVLFLHSSDEGGRGEGWRSGTGGKTGRVWVVGEEGEGISEREERRRAEEEMLEEKVWKYIY